jgi:hypothetical protein
MGFFDALFGRARIPEGKTDQIFALSTALLDIETRLSSTFAGTAAIVLRTVDNSSYDSLENDVKEVLQLGDADMPVTARHVDDTQRGDVLGEQAQQVALFEEQPGSSRAVGPLGHLA